MVLATVDSLKKFKNKLAYYFAIFAMVFGSTFVTFNAANANNVGNGLEWDSETGAAVFNTQNKILTISVPGNKSTNKVTGVTMGSGVTLGTILITDASGDVDALISGNTTASTFTVKTANGETGENTNMDFGDAVADLLTVTGNLHLNNLDTGAGSASLKLIGDIAVTGTTTLTSIGAANTAATTLLTIQDTATFTGAVTLDDGVASASGTSRILVTTDVANTITFTGGLLAAADGEGELEIGQVSAQINSIIPAATRLKLLDVNTASVFTGDVYADSITVDASADATFNADVYGTTLAIATANGSTIFKGNTTTAITTTEVNNVAVWAGTTAQTQTGAITSVADGDGIIKNSNTTSTVTFASTVGAYGANQIKDFQSDANTQTIFSAKLAADLITFNGTIELAVAENDAVDVNFAATSKLILKKTILKDTNVFNNVATEYSVAAGAQIYAPINLMGGEAIILLDGTDGTGDGTTAAAALNTAMVDSAIIDYGVSVDAGNDESDLTATYKTAAVAAADLGTTVNEAKALKEAFIAIQGVSAEQDLFEKALLNSDGTSSATLDTDLALQVAPQTDTIRGSAVATRAMTGTVQGIVSNRMASLRSGDAYVTGMSAGNGMSANSGFIQAFGSEAEQKNTGPTAATVYGYDSQTSGVAIGFDGMTETGETIGLSASFSTTDVDGKGTGKSKNAIDSYTVSVYADKATDYGYIEGSLTYGINDNTSSRIVNAAGLE